MVRPFNNFNAQSKLLGEFTFSRFYLSQIFNNFLSYNMCFLAPRIGTRFGIRVEMKDIGLIDDPTLTPDSLAHRISVSAFSLFYGYYHGSQSFPPKYALRLVGVLPIPNTHSRLNWKSVELLHSPIGLST